VQNKGWLPGAVRLHWDVDNSGYDAMTLGEFRRRYGGMLRVGKSELKPSLPLTGQDRAGSILEDHAPQDDEIVLVPRGGRKRSYGAVLGEHLIFRDIVTGRRREAAAVAMEFTSKWGLLSSAPYTLLQDILLMRSTFLSLLDGKKSFKALAATHEGLGLGSADIRISKRRASDAPDIFWHIRSLEAFVWLEYLAHAGGAAGLQRCQFCGEFFKRRGVSGPSPKYCGSACKQAAHRRRLVTSR
jgi:hypothetical protein